MPAVLPLAAAPAAPAGRPVPPRAVVVAVHVEHDRDEDLEALVAGLDSGDELILVHVRPSPAATSTPPPALLMSDLGILMFEDWRRACDEDEAVITARIAARSAQLRAAGVDHRVETVTYHRSMFTRRTRRSVRRAIERIADRVRADDILVGPGATLGAPGADARPPGTGAGDRNTPPERSPALGAWPRVSRPVDETRRLVDELWIDLGGSG